MLVFLASSLESPSSSLNSLLVEVNRELTNRRLLSRRRLLVTSCPGSVSRTIWSLNLITIPGRRLAQSNFLVTCLCLCWKNIIDICLKETARGTTREMPNLRETRNCIAYAYRKGFINDRELVLFYDANRSKNPDFQYWNYERFELDELTNAECNAKFRFYKNDIYKLADTLQLPDEFVTYNGLIVESSPALCIYLKRFSYPCRYSDMAFHFARPVPEICIITNQMIDWIYNRLNHLLTTYNHHLLSPANLRRSFRQLLGFHWWNCSASVQARCQSKSSLQWTQVGAFHKISICRIA